MTDRNASPTTVFLVVAAIAAVILFVGGYAGTLWLEEFQQPLGYRWRSIKEDTISTWEGSTARPQESRGQTGTR